MDFSKSTPDVSDVQDALILFADVIDSSKYSAVLGMMKYAERLLTLQKLFVKLGKTYFPTKDNIVSYYEVEARGDEGTIFCIDPDIEPADLVFKTLQFAYELKARIGLLWRFEDIGEVSAQTMKIGVGIHFGKVALITKIKIDEKGLPRSVIEGIEGFSINYGKRVESCSRLGKYSKVFLSKTAASLLDGYPVVLSKHAASMKGIEPSEEIYEVRSAFFEIMPLDPAGFDSEIFISTYTTNAKELKLVNEPWLKGLIISVLDSRLRAAKTDSLKSDYSNKLLELAWMKPSEDDPILLFWRAKECGEKGKHTQMLAYLKQIVELYPDFVHARKKLVKACWEVANKTSIRAEWVLARDIADEFLCRFSSYLSDEEKKYFEEIIQSTLKASTN